MHALINGLDHFPWPKGRSAAAQPPLTRVRSGEEVNPGLSDVNQLSRINALEQVSYLLTHPIASSRVETGTVSLHA